jgi:hypothetical protein
MFSVGFVAALALVVAGTASAATSIDLVFRGSGTSVTTVAGGSTAIMDIILTSDDGLIAASTSIAWDNGGTSVSSATEWSGAGVAFNTMNKAVITMSPLFLGPAGAFIDNGAQVVYAIDGAIPPPNNPPNLPSGTYNIGTMIWVADAGQTNISAVITSGIDIFASSVDLTGSVSLGTATINPVPEPGTASLLGLGLIGLIAAGRRNRA